MLVTVCRLWVLLGLTVAALGCHSWDRRTPQKLIFPSDEHGWFGVSYGVPDVPPLRIDHGCFRIDFRTGRLLTTQTERQAGWAKDLYYDISPDGTFVELRDAEEEAPGRGVRQRFTRFQHEPTQEVVSWFFVGTGEQLKADPEPPSKADGLHGER